MKGEKLQTIGLDKLTPTKDNPRIFVRDEEFKKLVTSVRENGIMQRVLVRRKSGKLELLAGERRFRAAKDAGLKEIPAIVHEGLTDAQAFDLTFHENFGREDLKPVEQGRAVELLLAKFEDIKVVAKKLGWSERAVRMRARLKDLIPAWKTAALDEKILPSKLSPLHLELIARLPAETQDIVYKQLKGEKWCAWGGISDYVGGVISLRELDRSLSTYVHVLKQTLWDLKECASCKKRSDTKDLAGCWSGGKTPVARCLDPVCWDKKIRETMAKQKVALQKEHKDLKFVTVNGEGATSAAKEHGALRPHQYIAAGKKSLKAMPAMIVNGPEAGRLTWIEPPKIEEGGTTRPGTIGKKSMAQKQKELDSKRWNHAIGILRDRVGECSLENVRGGAKTVISLAACFGTRDNKGEIWGFFKSNNKAGPWKKHDEKKTEAKALELLWEEVRPVIVERLTYSYGVTLLPPELWAEARRIAAFCKYDIAPILAKAGVAIPTPKSWGTKIKKPKGKPLILKKKKGRRRG